MGRTPVINLFLEISLFKTIIRATGSTQLKLIQITWTKIKISGVTRGTSKSLGLVKLTTYIPSRTSALRTCFLRANQSCPTPHCSRRARQTETMTQPAIRIYQDYSGSTKWIRRSCTRTSSCNLTLKSALRTRTRLRAAWLSQIWSSMLTTTICTIFAFCRSWGRRLTESCRRWITWNSKLTRLKLECIATNNRSVINCPRLKHSSTIWTAAQRASRRLRAPRLRFRIWARRQISRSRLWIQKLRQLLHHRAANH